MNKTLYKTTPRLLILTSTFGGFVFMGLLSRLIWVEVRHSGPMALYVIPFFFGFVSIWLFYLFLQIKVVRLSATTIQFSHLVLPIRKKYFLQQVRGISQHTKQISVRNGSSSPIRINYYVSRFTFTDNSIITTNSIGPIDFGELTRCYNKVTRGRGEFKMTNKKIVDYLIDSAEDIGIVILIVIATIGLGIAMLKGKY